MQNKLKLKIIGMFLGLFFQGILPFPVYGSQQGPVLAVAQRAQWTDEEEHRADIFVEISGLPVTYEEEEVKLPEEGGDTILFMEEQTEENIALVYYLSQYFLPDTERIPKEYVVEAETASTADGKQQETTKITVPVSREQLSQEQPSVISLPVVLKEEYFLNGEDLVIPLSKDVPWKETKGQGVYLVQTDTGECLASAEAVHLSKKQMVPELQMEVKTDQERVRAGEKLSYVIHLANTGETDLSNITLKSSISLQNAVFSWDEVEGLMILENTGEGILDFLEKGQEKTVRVSVEIPEAQTQEIRNAVTAVCQNPVEPLEMIQRRMETVTEVDALSVEYTVEKTADRTIARPGDIIRYQICIRNTGERTLHSVLSTERFQAADIQAVFSEKEGVELNAYKNQALIPEIQPGEAFALEATVTLPKDITDRDLLNEVTVITEETGTSSISSQAKIQVRAPVYTITPTPVVFFSPTPYPQNNFYKSGISNAKQASSSPKTSDDANPVLWGAVAGMAGGFGIVCFCLWHEKRKH